MRFITVAAVMSPVTLMVVRHISKIRSTPMMRAMPSAGMPRLLRIVASTTRPTPGVAGVPIDAPIVVSSKINVSAKLSSMPKTWHKNKAAMAWYMAVPSILIVAPRGIVKRLISPRIPRFSSAAWIEKGIVAALEEQ